MKGQGNGTSKSQNGASYKFEGWLGKDKSAVDGNMTWGEFEPKPWEETDVDIKVSHCGICGSDLHILRSGWGETPYPCCVGHEIVGRAVRVGSEVKHIQVGDRVGVGAQSDSCRNRNGKKCEACASGNEQYCLENVPTYAAYHFNGGKSYGGYATYNRVPAHFAIKIPHGISSAAAAPMMCGGVTLYSPLKHYGCGPGKRVGIVGVGGLGHFGVLFAKALGADHVVGISRKASKKEDVLKLGADAYLASDEENWTQKYVNSLDLILCTASSSKMPIDDYFSLLKQDGALVQVGAPEDGQLPVKAFNLIQGRKQLGGSMIGSPSDIREMLELAADKDIQPWIQERPMKDANQAVLDMNEGKARFRYVLVNEDA